MALYKILCIAIFFRNVATFENIANGKTVTQSTTHTGGYVKGDAYKAIDGNTNQTWVGRSCAHTALGKSQAWWRLDLGKGYSIYNIVIYFRRENSIKGGTFRSKGFRLYISDNPQPRSGYECYHHTEGRDPDPVQNIICKYPGRYVVVYQDLSGQKKPEAVLELCEVEVFGCHEGRFSTNCNGDCSAHCINRTCDVLIGNCRCERGYKGDRCNDECSSGFYGDGCRTRCGQCKFHSCHHKTGDCTEGCIAGFKGAKCTQACYFGTYGDNCHSECHCSSLDCNKETGVCPRGTCAPGWKSDTCSQECDHGTFGENCLQTCHCLNGENCYRKTGLCPFERCEAGWKLATCSQVCDLGTYGHDCKEVCSNCRENNCDPEEGRCYTFDKDLSITEWKTLAITSLGLLIAAICLFVCVFLYRKQKHQTTTGRIAETAQSSSNQTGQDHLYDYVTEDSLPQNKKSPKVKTTSAAHESLPMMPQPRPGIAHGQSHRPEQNTTKQS